jgi:hypothetical protein
LPKGLTLHLSDEEDEAAYLVQLDGILLNVFDDGHDSDDIGTEGSYLELDKLLQRFPNNMAWLSVSV